MYGRLEESTDRESTAKRIGAELRERAVQMIAEVRPDYGSQWSAICAVSGKLGMGSAETLRTWVRRAEVDAAYRRVLTSDQAAEVMRLKRENAELRWRERDEGRSGFPRGRARPARAMVIAFIREHKDQRVTGPDGLVGLRWGVEPICTVLAEHGINISPATY